MLLIQWEISSAHDQEIHTGRLVQTKLEIEKMTKMSLEQKLGLPPPECKYHRKNNREISWGSEVRIPCTYAAAAAFPYLKKVFS